MKKIIFIGFVILLAISMGMVCAENSTDTAISETNAQNTIDIEKNDLKFDVNFPEEVNKHYEGDGPYFYLTNATEEGTFKVYFDQKHDPDYDLTGGENRKEISPSQFSIGKHNITVAFSGSEIYNPANVSKTFDVVDVSITIPKEKATTGRDTYADVGLPSDATGYVSISVDGKELKKIDVGKISSEKSIKYIHQYLDLSLGKHLVEVRYLGDEKYSKASKKSEFDVLYDIYISNTFLTYGWDEIIEIYLPSEITKNLLVEINGKNYPAIYNSDSGCFNVDISDLSLGTHNIKVSYPGDKKYGENTISSTLTVRASISASNSAYYMAGNKISLKLPKDATGNLTVYISTEKPIDDINQSILYGNIKLKDGYAGIDISNLNIGSYYFLANYTGDDYQTYDIFNRGFFNICPRVVFPDQIKWGADEHLQVFTNPEYDQKLKFTFHDNANGKLQYSFEITPMNGTGSYSLKNLPIQYMYVDMDYYVNGRSDSRELGVINVIGVLPKLANTKDISMYYNDGTKFSVKVYGQYGKVLGAGYPITFKIGSNTYSTKTNSKGIATITLKETPGKYTITTIYKNFKFIEKITTEDGSYFKKSSKDIKVANKLVVKEVLTLKTVQVKKSAKKLVLTATLKNKKAIKNKQITFKFNGKTYKAKTNAKGVAKVTVKKAVLSKLKVGKKIAYSATYLKDTVKKTAKVKR